jgi:hypothetical protein
MFALFKKKKFRIRVLRETFKIQIRNTRLLQDMTRDDDFLVSLTPER